MGGRSGIPFHQSLPLLAFRWHDTVTHYMRWSLALGEVAAGEPHRHATVRVASCCSDCNSLGKQLVGLLVTLPHEKRRRAMQTFIGRVDCMMEVDGCEQLSP